MKTKWVMITGILMAMLIVPMALAADGRPGGLGDEGFNGPGPAVQQRLLLEDLTPEQRVRVREFIRNRIQEQMQRQQDQASGRGQGFGPQAFAGRGQERRQGDGPQGRAFAQEDFRGRGQGQMQRPFLGQGRAERPQAGPGQQRQCPCCGQPIARAGRPGGLRPDGPQAFIGRGSDRRPWAGAEVRPFARQDLPGRPQGEMMRRPFRDPGFEQPQPPREERPIAPQGMQGRGRGQGFGPQMAPNAQQDFRGRGRGFGPQAFDDAEGGQRPRTDEPQEFVPQRPRRGRVLLEPEDERLGDELEQQPRPGFRRNAQ